MFCNDMLLWLAAVRAYIKLNDFLRMLETASAQVDALHWREAEKDLQWAQKNHIDIITYHDDRYPVRLKEIAAAPLVLFCKGDVALLQETQLAMVGTRNPTVTGKENAIQFASRLAENNLIVTSGLALGVDAACHEGALKKGKTIAILGTGLQQIYPAANKKLAERIVENGLLVTEFPPDMGAQAKNFPLRNRIISGLSLGVLVVEAAIRSGSLITARLALEQNREVFAIPGSIHSPQSRGCHHLIRQGAKLVETAEDIMEELQWEAVSGVKQKALSSKKLDQNQRLILRNMGHEMTPLETIIIRSGLTAGEVSSILLSLELEGFVSSVTGGYARMR